MSYVVSRDLVGRRVVPHDAWIGSGSAPWAWKYNPGPQGAVILAIYAKPDGASSVLVFVVEGEEVVLEENALGGGSAKRTRIDEIVATECTLVPLALRCGRCGESVSQEVVDAGRHTCPRPRPTLTTTTHETNDGKCVACVACAAPASMRHVLSWAGVDDRTCRSLELCAQCHEGVGRVLQLDAWIEAGSGAEAIAKERRKQLEKWSLEHDDEEHSASPSKLGGLADAAIALLSCPPLPADADQWDRTVHEARIAELGKRNERWIERLVSKYANDRERQVTIAGAFCAAEIDRLHGHDQPKDCGP